MKPSSYLFTHNVYSWKAQKIPFKIQCLDNICSTSVQLVFKSFRNTPVLQEKYLDVDAILNFLSWNNDL